MIEDLFLDENDLSDIYWLVLNYGDKIPQYKEEENGLEKLKLKLEKMLNSMG
jgi:hypothetical protein